MLNKEGYLKLQQLIDQHKLDNRENSERIESEKSEKTQKDFKNYDEVTMKLPVPLLPANYV